MAQFVTTAFSDGNDVGLEVGFEEWVRTLSIGSTWNHIRIGLLYQLTGTASTLTGTGFSFGMCSGTSAPFGGTSTTNFVGIEVINALTWVSNSPNPYYQYNNTNVFACKKVGATITAAATNMADSAGTFVTTTSGTARRSMIYVDITKGSPNYTIAISLPPSGQQAVDWTLPFLLSGMNQAYGAITVNGVLINGLVGSQFQQTLACDEVAGGFDTVDLYVNELANPMRIFAVAVEKLA